MLPQFSHFKALFRVSVSILIVCIVAFISATVVIVVYMDTEPRYPVDCAIVFGAAVRGEGSAGPGIERRTQTAVRLYTEKKVQQLFFTGGKGSPEKESEAAVMRKVAMRLGVDSDHIILEEQARSTWENLEKSRLLMGDCDSVVGVSDRYHIARIHFLAWKQGWTNFQVQPADRKSTRYFEIRSVIREAMGLLYYTVQF